MGFVKKFLCAHKWKFHDKKEVIRTKIYVNGYKEVDNLTTEILICDNCGKIKKILY